MANYNITVTATTITFEVWGLTAGDVVCNLARLASDPSDQTVYRWETATGYYHEWTYSGLTPNTAYIANVSVNDSWIGTQSFTTDSALNYAALSFDANGGSGAPDGASANGSSVTLPITIPTNTPTRSGYTFLGWSKSQTATAPTYYPGVTYDWDASASGTIHILYAVWQENVVYGVVYIDGVPYVPYIYNNGWKRANAYVYDGGWNITRKK